jgi:hypothetical protein
LTDSLWISASYRICSTKYKPNKTKPLKFEHLLFNKKNCWSWKFLFFIPFWIFSCMACRQKRHEAESKLCASLWPCRCSAYNIAFKNNSTVSFGQKKCNFWKILSTENLRPMWAMNVTSNTPSAIIRKTIPDMPTFNETWKGSLNFKIIS